MATKSHRFPRLRVFLPVLAITAAAILVAFLVRTRPSPEADRAELGQSTFVPRIGARLPDFVLTDLPGGKPLRASELRPQVRLITFWATWCEACLAEMPSLARLGQSYGARGLDVLTVNVDEDLTEIAPTLQKLGVELPVYRDPGNRLASLLEVEAIPTTIVVDRDRRILLLATGDRDWTSEEFRKQLEAWLSG